MNRSLIGIWLVVLVAAIALAVLMNGLFRLGIDARVDTVAARVDRASALLETRFTLYDRSFSTPPDLSDPQRRRELALILQLVLQDFEDVEGGFFGNGDFLAYAFPSYEGSGTKQDVPEAESSRIARLSQAAIDAGAKQVSRVGGERQMLIVEARPLRHGTQTIAVWVMSRAHVRADDAARRLFIGLGLLGVFVVGSGLLFAAVLLRWHRGLRTLGDELLLTAADRPMPPIETGHPDLDRVAGMVSALHERLRAERRASAALENELARARRVGSLGRMTAQLVHEVRNPIAAMRLRAENALAGSSERDRALEHILKDVHRLDDLLERMQAMTRLTVQKAECVALPQWVEHCVASVAERAERSNVVVSAAVAPDATWCFDPVQLGRALENLVLNGIAHARRGDGAVDIRIETVPDRTCRIEVSDNGSGIAMANRDQIFDPFFTTRDDGTGLGLSIAREIVEAHGGTLSATDGVPSADGSTGACFVIEIPWRAS